MNNCLFSKKNFKIIKANNGFIIVNILRDFDEGHTHINNYYVAKVLINVCIKGNFSSKNIRFSNDKRFVTSCNRICDKLHKPFFESILQKIKEEEVE